MTRATAASWLNVRVIMPHRKSLKGAAQRSEVGVIMSRVGLEVEEMGGEARSGG